MNKYNWERINFPSNKDDWKKYKKKQCSNCSYVTMLKVKRYTPLMFQNITEIVKNKLCF